MASEIKTGAILNYVSIVVRLATSFLLTPFVIAALGVEEYGLFMLSGSVIAWLALTDLGPIGMFIGTAVSLTFGQVIMINLYYKRKAGLLIGTFFRRAYLPILILCALLAGVGLALAYFWQVDTWIDLFIAIAVYGSLIFVTLFGLYLNQDEKNMFLSPLKKILHLS